jgi:hypothetical protein
MKKEDLLKPEALKCQSSEAPKRQLFRISPLRRLEEMR